MPAPPSCRAAHVVALFVCVLAGCSGGNYTPPDTDVPAVVPSGTGIVPIDMVGTWEIRASVIMETNVPTALPPASGTLLSIGPGEVQSIAGLSVRREDLETLLGGPLELYLNRVDGRTVFYAATFDRRAQGGTREEVALAGGSVNADTMAVEQITSTLLANAATAAFVRARYTLVRAATSLTLGDAPVPDPARPLPTLLQALRPLTGGDRDR